MSLRWDCHSHPPSPPFPRTLPPFCIDSYLTFATDPALTYFVVVAGWGGETGDVTVSLWEPCAFWSRPYLEEVVVSGSETVVRTMAANITAPRSLIRSLGCPATGHVFGGDDAVDAFFVSVGDADGPTLVRVNVSSAVFTGAVVWAFTIDPSDT